MSKYESILKNEPPLPEYKTYKGITELLFDKMAEAKIEKWDRRFLEFAQHISNWSLDPSTKVGAVLVNDLKQVVGMGYNGFARGIADTNERLNDRETKYKLVVHAEINAIIQAGHAARGSVLYVYPSFMIPPICHDCCKAAIQAGIVGIVGYQPDETDPRVQRWKDSIAVSKGMWEEVGLWIRTYQE
jgi:dCMP deaminase